VVWLPILSPGYPFHGLWVPILSPGYPFCFPGTHFSAVDFFFFCMPGHPSAAFQCGREGERCEWEGVGGGPAYKAIIDEVGKRCLSSEESHIPGFSIP
jgi:hypothetical protein